MKIAQIFVAATAVTLLTACADSYTAIPTASQLPRLPTTALADAERPTFRFAVGDEIELRFINTPDLNDRQIIRPDGMITPPHIGDRMAAGLTVPDLRAALLDAYRPILRDPELSISARELGGQRVFVGGEVFMPGPQPISGRPTVVAAIMAAQGFRPTARLSEVVVLRGEAGGIRRAYVVNVADALSGRRPETDAVLASGDIVFVPRSNIATLNLAVDQFIRQMNPFGAGISLQVPVGN